MRDTGEVRALPPGEHARWFARQNGWDLSDCTVFVEGSSDVKYLAGAALCYARESGKHLLSSRFSIVAIGMGTDGGTDGLLERFWPLRQVIAKDCTASGRILFKTVALFDGDPEGMRSCSYMLKRYTTLKKYKDVFILHRSMPRSTREPAQLERAFKTANRKWLEQHCVIEDFLDPTLLEVFLDENPTAIRKGYQKFEGGFHVDLNRDGKSKLCRWYTLNAAFAEYAGLLEVIKSLRYYCGLDPDGD